MLHSLGTLMGGLLRAVVGLAMLASALVLGAIAVWFTPKQLVNR